MATEQVMATKKVNLPRDILETNILKRLPVKILIRFTSVCKSWYSLLSNPYFITQRNKHKINNLLFVDYDNSIVVTDSCSKEQSSISNIPRRRVGVIGCCDGIVCVSGISYGGFFSNAKPRLDISLWNPALRINKTVATIYEPGHCLDMLCFGFGYSNKTKDYNVIRFAYNYLTTLNLVEVYSLASDSWRKVQLSGPSTQLLTKCFTVETFGVCYPDGAYCWMAVNDFFESRIISFHMEDEAFKEMTIPYTSGRLHGNTLFIYKDSLAVLRAHDSYAIVSSSQVHVSRIFYIWVMKEFGDPKSWTILWKFDSQRPYAGVSFLGFIGTNLILLRFYEKVGNGTTPKEVNVFDIEKSETNPINYTKDISFLAKAKWITSITESLALL